MNNNPFGVQRLLTQQKINKQDFILKLKPGPPIVPPVGPGPAATPPTEEERGAPSIVPVEGLWKVDTFDVPWQQVKSMTTPHLGAIIRVQQKWTQKGLSLGRLVKSLSLAPGEAMRVGTVDWARESLDSETNVATMDAQLRASIVRDRAVAEVSKTVATELQRGSSSSRTQSYGQQHGGSFGLFGLFGSSSGSSSNIGWSESSSVSTGERNVLNTLNQTVQDITTQAASETRSRFGSTVVVGRETEAATSSSRVICNYNHMHMLNVLYFEAVQLFEVVQSIDTVVPGYCWRPEPKLEDLMESDLARKILSEIALNGKARSLFLYGMEGTEIYFHESCHIVDTRVLNGLNDAEWDELYREKAWDLPLRNVPGGFQVSGARLDPTVVIEAKVTEGGAFRKERGSDETVDVLHLSSGFAEWKWADGAIRGRFVITLSSGGTNFMSYEVTFDKQSITHYPPFTITQPINDSPAGLIDLEKHWEQFAGYYVPLLAKKLPLHVAFSIMRRGLPNSLDQSKPHAFIGECFFFPDSSAALEVKRTLNYVPLVAARPNRPHPPKPDIYIERVFECVLPSGGLYSEAILGEYNCAEEIDLSRFSNWQDSPIPLVPQELQFDALGSRHQSTTNFNFPEMTPVIKQQDGATLPDPLNTSSTVAANTSLFRDMAGLAQTTAMLQASLNSSAAGAQAASKDSVEIYKIGVDFLKSALDAAMTIVAPPAVASKSAVGKVSLPKGMKATPTNVGGMINALQGGSSKDPAKAKAARDSFTEGARTHVADFYKVGDFTVVDQGDTNLCWAACLAMMLSWKNGKLYTIETALEDLPALFKNKLNDPWETQPLPGKFSKRLADEVGLKVMAQGNLTAAGWMGLLKNHGPLWIGTLEKAGGHARLIEGYVTDGTDEGTTFFIVDPDGGNHYTERYLDLMVKYEEAATDEGNIIVDYHQVRYW